MFNVHAASHGAGQTRPVNSGKVIRAVQNVERGFPVLPIDQVVEVRDDVVDRAALIAKRNTAVHAARRLHAGRIVGQMNDEFAPMLGARARRFGSFFQPLIFEEPGDLAHVLLMLPVTKQKVAQPSFVCCSISARAAMPKQRSVDVAAGYRSDQHHAAQPIEHRGHRTLRVQPHVHRSRQHRKQHRGRNDPRYRQHDRTRSPHSAAD